MTLTNCHCPACRAPLPAGRRYCTHCGLEVCPPCPGCAGAPRLLATLQRGPSPWCEQCERLLLACERCGRWLLPGGGHCPDPQCGGRVLSPFPLQTGRRWDGTAQTDWTWPVTWEREHPSYAPPRVEWWTSHGEVQAAFLAHGRCYVWEAGSLVSPDDPHGWQPRADAMNASTVSWRSPLGTSQATAARVPGDERVAVLGSRAVLATERGFAQVDLRHAGDHSVFWSAVPLAQVASPTAWAAWATEQGSPVFRVASSPPAGAPIQPDVVPLPPEAGLARRGRLVQSEACVYWPGQNGTVWEFDFETRMARVACESGEGLLDLWVGPGGPRVVRESLGQISVALTPSREGLASLAVPAGAGPFRGLYGQGALLVVVGERVVTFDVRTGDRLHEALRPPGIWVGAVLARTPDREPRLLTLTRDRSFASLTVTRLSSGVQDLLWREDHLEPKALLPVADTLYLVHSRGLIRFRS